MLLVLSKVCWESISIDKNRISYVMNYIQKTITSPIMSRTSTVKYEGTRWRNVQTYQNQNSSIKEQLFEMF